MSNPYEEMSNAYASRNQTNTDANLALDSLCLGGIEADEYALKSFVKAMATNILKQGKQYTDDEIAKIELAIKAYIDNSIKAQDFSRFATKSDLDAAILRTIEQCNQYVNNQITNIHIENYVTIEDLQEGINGLQTQIDELFQSVSNGKNLIASALTDKGVQAGANESFVDLANKILQITGETGLDTSDATASASDIKIGKSAYANGQKIYGTHEEATNGTDTTDATATPEDIRTGKIAYANGQKLTGTLSVNVDSEGNTIGVPDISETVTKIYSEVSDKVILLNNNVGVEYSSLICMGAYNESVVDYIVKGLKEDGRNKIQIVALRNGIPVHTKTWNAIEFGIPNDTEDTTYTMKYIYMSNFSATFRYMFIVTCDSKGNNTLYVTRISQEKIESDSGKIDLSIVPYWYEIQGDTTSTKHVNHWNTTFFSSTNYTIDDRISVKVFPGDNNTFAICYNLWKNSNSYLEVEIYELFYITDESGNYIIHRASNDEKSSGTNWYVYGSSHIPKIEFANGGKLMSVAFNNIWYLYMLDDLHLIKTSEQLLNSNLSGGGTHISNDGMYGLAIQSGKITRYKIIADYEKSTISWELDTTNGSADALYQDEYTSKAIVFFHVDDEDKFLYLFWSDGGTWDSQPVNCAVYGLDFASNDILHLLSIYSDSEIKYGSVSATDDSRLRILQNGNLCFINTSNNLIEFRPKVNYQDVIGLQYDGKTFYDLSALRLTAKQSDVRYGKTFVGKSGVREIGTALIAESGGDM